VIPRHSKGHKGMDNDDVQSVHEAARIVDQRPAQAQHQEHHQQCYDTLMYQGASACHVHLLQVVEHKDMQRSGRFRWTDLVDGGQGVCVCVCVCVL